MLGFDAVVIGRRPRMMRRLTSLVAIAAVTLSSTGFADEPASPPRDATRAAKLDFFETHIRPLLVEKCYECHSAEYDESAGGLRLDSAAAMQAGGARGAVVQPGKPAASLLLRAIEYEDPSLEMPPAGKLTEAEIAAVRQWIADGAVDPRHEDTRVAAAAEAIDPDQHWAFQPFQRAAADAFSISPRDDCEDVIDALVDSRLAGDEELERSPRADRETLLRRVTYDLTGLAPTADQIEAFVNDPAPDAYERVVDSLLADPAFGERFARHWMDVARYADTVGYTLAGRERRLKGSERFRDWTIGAFNRDLPYDAMIRYQLAADRLDPENADGNLDAMGFLTVGRRFLNKRDTIDDRIDVIGRGLLGLTVACARCHDHKFDPIPTVDYYALYGVMQSSRENPDGPSPLMLVDHNPHDERVLIRGQAGNRGEVAPRQFLTALRKDDEPRFQTGSGRLDLAQRIATGDNPLTARVMANRVWMQLIGRPLVRTPSDFGVRSDPPAIPEILDDLAAEFAGNWSIKRLVRRIVLTGVYRQSSDLTPEMLAADPDNRWLARGNRQRRDFESLRDRLLAVSGHLSGELGGPGVDILTNPQPPRRTLYAFVDRQNLPGLFRAFDFASPDAHTPQRAYTTVPQQALFLMNSPMVLAAAARLNTQLGRHEAPADFTTALYQRVFGREPTAQEHEIAVAFLKQPTSTIKPPPDPRSLWQYGYSELTDAKTAGSFTPLTHFEKGAWKHPEFANGGDVRYLQLTKSGGHPGNGNQYTTNRRWTAPLAGKVKIRGTMDHATMKGNGVQIAIATGDRLLWQVKLAKRRRPFGPISVDVQAGQTIDFLTGFDGDLSHDSFTWKIKLQLIGGDGTQVESDSEMDFSGPFDAQHGEPLSRREQLAQVLLMSNEFVFVD